jgi:hypothetical protein
MSWMQLAVRKEAKDTWRSTAVSRYLHRCDDSFTIAITATRLLIGFIVSNKFITLRTAPQQRKEKTTGNNGKNKAKNDNMKHDKKGTEMKKKRKSVKEK